MASPQTAAGARFLKKLAAYKLRNPTVSDLLARRRISKKGGQT